MCIVRKLKVNSLLEQVGQYEHYSSAWVNSLSGRRAKKKRSLFINTANDLQNNYSICFKYPEAIFQYFWQHWPGGNKYCI